MASVDSPSRLDSVAAPARSSLVKMSPRRPRWRWLCSIWSASVDLPQSMVPEKKTSSGIAGSGSGGRSGGAGSRPSCHPREMSTAIPRDLRQVPSLIMVGAGPVQRGMDGAARGNGAPGRAHRGGDGATLGGPSHLVDQQRYLELVRGPPAVPPDRREHDRGDVPRVELHVVTAGELEQVAQPLPHLVAHHRAVEPE